MKKLISLLLALLVCAACLLPTFAETTETETEATTAAENAETSAPAPTEPDTAAASDWTTTAIDAESPAPTNEVTRPAAGETETTTAAPDETQATTVQPTEEDGDSSLRESYETWKGDRGDNARYHRAYRKFYATDPDLTIVDHMVFKKHEKTKWNEAYYALLDYFDTDEAEATTVKLRIPSKVNGLPVSLRLYGDDDYVDGYFYNGYSNDTVRLVVLEEGFTGVASYAFTNFTALLKVKIPKTVTVIGYGAFCGCKWLQKIVGGENIAEVRSFAFDGCARLASFPHMETLRLIEGNAFSGCAFKKLNLSGDLRLSIGDEDNYSAWNAFADCKNLKAVTFLDGSGKKGLLIGMGSFRGCTSLKTVTLPKKCPDIQMEDNAFYGCTSLQTLKNLDKLTEIGRFTFANCTSLTSVTLPAGIKFVAEDAFKGCKGLKTLDLRSKNIDLFSQQYNSGWSYQLDDYNGVSTNFIKFLPKKCTVYVVNKDMKLAVKAHGCRGTVKIRVAVGAPKTFKAAKQGSAVRLQWSKVKNADGYRLYVYNTKTKTFEKLKTVKAPILSATVKTDGKTFAVRAFRKVDGDVSWGAAVRCKL
ncbi:MAG: leucine-rich repeat domain-containing protein [Clostridia bacterium]|nr:leucine-rich repeat domain-containing protein [Clostridia bacterium]